MVSSTNDIGPLQKGGEMFVSEVTVVMLVLEVLDVGMNTMNKAAMSKGMSNFVLVVYSNILGIFLLLPSAMIFYRKRAKPPLTWSIISRIFLLGLISCSGQVFTYAGIAYSSPTLNSAMADLTPAFTFILAIISRMEKLDLRVKSSQAKSLGTLLLITGGLVVALYKGLPIITTTSSKNYKLVDGVFLSAQSEWTIGGFFLAAHSFTLAVFYIVQTWIMRDYPAELMVTLFCCVFVAILSSIVALVAEKDPNAWRIRPDIELIAIGYSAVFAVAIRTLGHTWACHKKGPVYTSMFKPLGMLIAVLMGVSVLGDTLYLGSVIGGLVITFGFYAVIWGKAQEEKFSYNEPLLQNESSRV